MATRRGSRRRPRSPVTGVDSGRQTGGIRSCVAKPSALVAARHILTDGSVISARETACRGWPLLFRPVRLDQTMLDILNSVATEVRGSVVSPVSVYCLHPLQDPRWAEFVAKQPDSSVFHTVPWLEALHRTYGYEPIAY